MNARQKAKKFKKLAQKLEQKALLYDAMERSLYYERLRQKRDIQTCKFKIYVPFVPVVTNTDDAFIDSLYKCESENAKRQLAKEIANFLLDNNLLWIESERDPVKRNTIYTASLKVVK